MIARRGKPVARRVPEPRMRRAAGDVFRAAWTPGGLDLPGISELPVDAVLLAADACLLLFICIPGARRIEERALWLPRRCFPVQVPAECRRAGFQQVRLRGDTDFSQTEHLDRWTTDGVKFVCGIQAMQGLYVHAENLPRNAWQELSRPAKYDVKTEPRQRPTNIKQLVVEDRSFTDIRLAREHVAEFRL